MPDPRLSGIRERIEAAFEAWGRTAFRHPGSIVAVMGLLSALLISGVPRLETDNSMESFLRADDPIRIVYDDFRRQFGRDERMSIAIEAPDIFAPEFLERLRALHEDLEREVPHIADLTSMINARDTRGDEEGLVVEDLLADWPERPEDFERLRQRVLGNPLYRNTLISRDADVTTISIRLVTYADGEEDATGGFEDEAGEPAGDPVFLPEPEISAAVRATRDVVARHTAPDFRIRLAGGPVMSERLNTRMQEDMGVFTLWCLAAIGLFLYLLFRRVGAVLMPLLVVGLSMLSTLGVISFAGGTISVATQILPSLLLAVGVCDSVHILSIYYQRLRAGSGREDAVAYSLGHSGLPVVMTSITTAGGLGSFALAELKPVADLGVYAPFGVMFALVYTVVLLPALLALWPTAPAPAPARRNTLSRALEGLGDFSASHPWGVVSVSLALLVIAGMGIGFLRFSHDPIDWFPEDEPFRDATLFMNEHLDGVNVVEMLVRTGEENGVHDPELLGRLDAVRRDAARIHQGIWHIGKTISIADVVKETHQALNENRPEFYAIPGQRELVAQELLLFEASGSDDLQDIVDPLFSTARITMRVPWMDSIAYPDKLEDLTRRVRAILGEDVGLEVTGLVPVFSATFRAMLVSMGRSYVVALLVIAPLMVLLIGHVTRGLLSMIPNLAPVIVMLGYMGWSGVPVDGLTMMLGAIVIGLAVDDTIHFMHNFRRYHDQSGDARDAIHRTLQTTGRALLVTSLVLAAGFFTFAGAYMTNVRLFGLLTGGAILVAFVSNVVLSSALMVLATRRVRFLAFSPEPVWPMRGAMSEGIDPQGGEIEVSPEEERFLKRFFRRQALPWFVLAALIGVTAAWGLRGGTDDALEARTSAALAQLRSENEKLRGELSGLGARLEASGGTGKVSADELERSVESARRNVRMIESRVTAALERRLDALETRIGSAPVLPAGGTPELPSDASAWDVSSILERLYALEMSQEHPGSGTRDAGAASRLAALERRLAQLEEREAPSAPPAAPLQ